jgi:hypothetical protein
MASIKHNFSLFLDALETVRADWTKHLALCVNSNVHKIKTYVREKKVSYHMC